MPPSKPRPPATPSVGTGDPSAAARRKRLGEALRANLRRRKDQARQRDADAEDKPESSRES
jgi:hypothetical protein